MPHQVAHCGIVARGAGDQAGEVDARRLVEAGGHVSREDPWADSAALGSCGLDEIHLLAEARDVPAHLSVI